MLWVSNAAFCDTFSGFLKDLVTFNRLIMADVSNLERHNEFHAQSVVDYRKMYQETLSLSVTNFGVFI